MFTLTSRQSEPQIFCSNKFRVVFEHFAANTVQSEDCVLARCLSRLFGNKVLKHFCTLLFVLCQEDQVLRHLNANRSISVCESKVLFHFVTYSILFSWCSHFSNCINECSVTTHQNIFEVSWKKTTLVLRDKEQIGSCDSLIIVFGVDLVFESQISLISNCQIVWLDNFDDQSSTTFSPSQEQNQHHRACNQRHSSDNDSCHESCNIDCSTAVRCPKILIAACCLSCARVWLCTPTTKILCDALSARGELRAVYLTSFIRTMEE